MGCTILFAQMCRHRLSIKQATGRRRHHQLFLTSLFGDNQKALQSALRI